MPAGRPSKYDDKTPEEWSIEIKKYIDSCEDKIEPINGKEGVQRYEIWANIPMVQGLAAYLCLSKDTIYQWAKEYKEFSYALTEIENKQCQRLVNGGLGGQYTSGVVNRMLAANHGMAEKTESKNQTDMNVSGGVVILPNNGEHNMETTSQAS